MSHVLILKHRLKKCSQLGILLYVISHRGHRNGPDSVSWGGLEFPQRMWTGMWPETTETKGRKAFSSWASGYWGLSLQEGKFTGGHPQREKICRLFHIA